MVDWSTLDAALARCRSGGVELPFWWRDDDAIAQTQALDRLSALSQKLECPVHLAVIAGHAEQSLVDAIKSNKSLIPIVHGWRHENHAPSKAKKAEFGHLRPEASQELHNALTRLSDMFDATLVPVFVPPWNRFDIAFAPALRDAGFAAISTYLPRARTHMVPGLMQVNTHVDPIEWRGSRGLADPDMILARTVERLTARCDGTEDAAEPLGLLTHHLVHLPEVWQFTESFVARLLDGGAKNTPLKSLLETSS